MKATDEKWKAHTNEEEWEGYANAIRNDNNEELGCFKCPDRAHLAAAAPDLYRALELALEYWSDRQQRYKNRAPAWVVSAREALAKARGEE